MMMIPHNLTSEVIFSDHEPKQNESSITFSPRSDPLHHEFAGELLTLPSRNDREFGEYLSLMTVLCEISTSQSKENQSSVIESLPVSPIPVEDSVPVQEEIDIFLVPDDLIPPSSTHGRVNISLLASYWLNPSKRGHVGLKIAQGIGIFTLESLLEKAQGVTITDCHAGNPCVHICDPRVENYSPMIESLYGKDG
ncbi:hypothetical protein Tco_1406849 [Tanacetum coccineum]